MASRFDEEGMTALDRGRQRYQRQDYKGALEAFSEVGSMPCASHLCPWAPAS